jgi:hypothetical protein
MKILCGNSSNPSARLLRDALQEILGGKILVTHRPETIRRNEYFIRYGSGKAVVNGIDLNLNSAELVCVAGSKREFSEMTHEKIYTPLFRKSKPEKFPLLIRTTLHGWGGEGIIVCKSAEEFNANWRPEFWWTEFVHTEFEIRAHIHGGKVIKVFKKILPEGATEDEFPIRHNSNYHFSLVSSDKYPKLISAVNRLCEDSIFGDGYFAVDAGWDAEKKEYFIFEINSAPGLNEFSAYEYAVYIYERMNQNWR